MALRNESLITKVVKFDPETLAAINALEHELHSITTQVRETVDSIRAITTEIRETLRRELPVGDGYEDDVEPRLRFPEVLHSD